MRVVRELSDQIWMRVLFYSLAHGETRMRVVRELNDQIWMTVLLNSHERGQKRMRVVRELSDQIWIRVLLNSRECGQKKMRAVGELSDQIWMTVLFNSHARDHAVDKIHSTNVRNSHQLSSKFPTSSKLKKALESRVWEFSWTFVVTHDRLSPA